MRALAPALSFLAIAGAGACSTDPTFVGASGSGGQGASGSPSSASSGGDGAGASGGASSTGGCGGQGCGCPRDCLGGACLDGKCQPVAILDRASGLEGVWSGILVDGPDLFVGDLGSGDASIDGKLLRMAKDGSDVTILVPQGETTAWEMATDVDSVFWLSPTEAQVSRVAKSGGPVQVVASDQPPSDVSEPSGIAVSEGYVYWATFGTWRRAAVGSSGAQSDFEAGTSPASIVAGGKSGDFFLSDRDGWIYRKDPAAESIPLVRFGAPGALALDSDYVYWLDGSSAGVARADRAGNIGATKLADGAPRPTGLAVDETHVYWTTRGDCDREPACWSGTVNRVDKAGASKPEVLAEGPWPVFDVAVDDSAVYFTTGPAGVVYRVAK